MRVRRPRRGTAQFPRLPLDHSFSLMRKMDSNVQAWVGLVQCGSPKLSEFDSGVVYMQSLANLACGIFADKSNFVFNSMSYAAEHQGRRAYFDTSCIEALQAAENRVRVSRNGPVTIQDANNLLYPFGAHLVPVHEATLNGNYIMNFHQQTTHVRVRDDYAEWNCGCVQVHLRRDIGLKILSYSNVTAHFIAYAYLVPMQISACTSDFFQYIGDGDQGGDHDEPRALACPGNADVSEFQLGVLYMRHLAALACNLPLEDAAFIFNSAAYAARAPGDRIFRETCCAETLQAAGYDVQIDRSGPMTFQDGANLLAPFGARIVPVQQAVLSGDYIVHYQYHFIHIRIMTTCAEWNSGCAQVYLARDQALKLLSHSSVVCGFIFPGLPAVPVLPDIEGSDDGSVDSPLGGGRGSGSMGEVREDFYKKCISADPISGRLPYGISTKLLFPPGWKRIELHKTLSFFEVHGTSAFNAVRGEPVADDQNDIDASTQQGDEDGPPRPERPNLAGREMSLTSGSVDSMDNLSPQCHALPRGGFNLVAPGEDLISCGAIDSEGEFTCLNWTLNALGARVPTNMKGPFRALEHGNAWLAELGLELVRQPRGPSGPGGYVKWEPPSGNAARRPNTRPQGHFTAAVVYHEGVIVTNRENRRFVSTGYLSIDDIPDVRRHKWFLLQESSSGWENVDLLGGAAASGPSVSAAVEREDPPGGMEEAEEEETMSQQLSALIGDEFGEGEEARDDALKEEPAADDQRGADAPAQRNGGEGPSPPKRPKYDGLRSRITSAARLSDSLGDLFAEDGAGEASQLQAVAVEEGPQLFLRAKRQLQDVALLLPTDATWVANVSDDPPTTLAKCVAREDLLAALGIIKELVDGTITSGKITITDKLFFVLLRYGDVYRSHDGELYFYDNFRNPKGWWGNRKDATIDMRPSVSMAEGMLYLICEEVSEVGDEQKGREEG